MMLWATAEAIFGPSGRPVVFCLRYLRHTHPLVIFSMS